VEPSLSLPGQQREALTSGSKAVVKLLTDEQRQQWKTIAGKPFMFE
jgi:hypothetical protein